MIFSTEKPKIYSKLHDKFGVDWDKGIIITCGETIHCKHQLQPQKVHHEVTHTLQQEEIGEDNWWTKYLSDVSFRLEQEVQAYEVEAKWIMDNVKDKNLRYELIRGIWIDLSSSIYGNIVTFEQAKTLIPYKK